MPYDGDGVSEAGSAIVDAFPRLDVRIKARRTAIIIMAKIRPVVSVPIIAAMARFPIAPLSLKYAARAAEAHRLLSHHTPDERSFSTWS